MSTVSYQGRLPGVSAEIALPQRKLDRLRLDVAGFVGFAERGPVDTPVLIEDLRQFIRIFGSDFIIARYDGLPIYAHLLQAVKAFFDNGGRRCYVVRVVGETARANQFRMPGMAARHEDGSLSQVTIPAAWVGRWSDSMQIATQQNSFAMTIQERPTGVTASYVIANATTPATAMVTFAVDAPNDGVLLKGDMVCLRFDDDASTCLYARVETAEISQLTVALADTLLLGTVVSVNNLNNTKEVIPQARRNQVPLTVTTLAGSLVAFQERISSLPAGNPSIERLEESGWVAVATTLANPELQDDTKLEFIMPEMPTLSLTDSLRLIYTTGGEEIICTVDNASLEYDSLDNLQQRIICRNLMQDIALVDLPIAPVQADRLRFNLYIREGQANLEIWQNLSFGNWTSVMASDEILTDKGDPNAIGILANLSQRSMQLGQPQASNVNFFLPMGMDMLPDNVRPLVDTDSSDKDGLDHFLPKEFFLDPNFDNFGWRRIMERVNDLRFMGNKPIKLIRMHSLLIVDEIGLIALPDLVHRPWGEVDVTLPEDPPPEVEEGDPCDPAEFCDCPLIEEPVEAEDSISEIITPPTEDPGVGDFFNQLAQRPVLNAADDYLSVNIDRLLTVQRALIELCAATKDRIVILTLPHHFERSDILDWDGRLRATPAFYDGNPLSYAAVYHGWLQIVEANTPELTPLRNVPPDGAVCGLIAQRELQRGVWVAPANDNLRGVVGLLPNFNETDSLDLFDRQMNLLVQKPGRFTTLSAHTLSTEHQFLQISVRRLLIWLRELLLREDNRYVFEVNNERFWRYVRTGLERRLTQLVQAGALKAFEVDTGRNVMTQQDIDQGRFIVEIRIAPTQPIEYITIVMLRTGEDVLEILER